MAKIKILSDGNGVCRITLDGDHVTVRAITLRTVTDIRDTLVDTVVRHVYKGKLELLFGQIFIFDNYKTRETAAIIVPAPDCITPELSADEGVAVLNSFGYPVYAAIGALGDGERLCREWYRTQYSSSGLHAMSNTWGDRNGRTRVNDAFIRREIESGADLGLDVVQIDDGWQLGVPDVFDEDGLRVFEGNFWDLKTDIFPNGMRSLSDYANEKGTQLGLWFAPHSRGVFEHFDRDFSVLKKAYDDWNIRYFKLDMIQLNTPAHCDGMCRFLDGVFALGNGVSVELDVTADKRLGYLMSAPYGTIFVENRYTAWSNYYPHRTLKNLWSLSRFIPTAKLQMELINTDLYTDKYSQDDPFRHELYDIDYLFACVMFSNPLFWMETQFLSENNRARLKKIVSLWRAHRDSLKDADVYPIGEEPTGRSMTGFVADCGDTVQLILIRENTEHDAFTFDIGVNISDTEIVASNCDAQLSLGNKTVCATLSRERSYVWIKAKRVK